MNDIKKYLHKDFVTTLSLYFTLIFLIINLGIFLLNINYKNNTSLQKNEAFKSIVEHMITYDDEESINEYIEHYSHVHNTAIMYYLYEDLMFETNLKGEDYAEYELVIDGEIIGSVLIDDTYSTNILLNSTFLFVINFFIVFLYLISILLFYGHTKRKVSLVLDDIEKLKKNDNKYNFFQFDEISNRISQINNNYLKLKQKNTDELRAVTHDMKTPLTILLSYIEGMSNNRIEADESNFNVLKDEINALNRLIESINRSESSIDKEEINFSNILTEQVERFMHVFSTKGISVDLEVDDDIKINSERESLSRIIYNLLSNCFYYTKQNGKINISLKSGDDIVLSIKDNGVGIRKDDINRIFKKNYRVENTRSLHKKGTGLGLYIVKLLVEELDGSISVKSELNIGTEFIIKFKGGLV